LLASFAKSATPLVYALLGNDGVQSLDGNRFLDMGLWGTELVKQIIPPEYRPVVKLAYDFAKNNNLLSFRVPVTSYVDYASLDEGVYRFDISMTAFGAEPPVDDFITHTFAPQVNINLGEYPDNVVAIQTFGDFTRPDNFVANIREEKLRPSTAGLPPPVDRFISTISVVATVYLTLAKSALLESDYVQAPPESGFIFNLPIKCTSDTQINNKAEQYQNFKADFSLTMVPNFNTLPPRYIPPVNITAVVIDV